MEPGKPPEKFEGSESVRSLGGLWVLCEGRGEMPGGGTATTLMTLGYDPQKKRYVGTFDGIDDDLPMGLRWVAGRGGKVLTLNAEGPSCAGEGKLAKYQDVIEVKSDDHRVLTSHMLGDDGKWHEFMTANYRRKK